MKSGKIRLFAAGAGLVGLPMLGIWIAGHPVDRYLQFPPIELYVNHAPFSWAVFIFLAGMQVALLMLAWRAASRGKGRSAPSAVNSFPAWGWGALLWTGVWWVLAWTRFDWFAYLQHHTFTPLWLGYIVVVNALTYRQSGRCWLTHETGYLLKLFPLSAVFWWFFEYLNRFVQNWTYQGVGDFSRLEYFVFATLSFSTVLPAVMSTAEWLRVRGIARGADGGALPVLTAGARRLLFGLSLAGLLFLGVYPNVFFPFLWLAPLGFVLMFQSLEKVPEIFPTIGTFLRLSLAALLCGLFWEAWNLYSLAKWVYHVPYVLRFHVFEMPLLGYFGYLPFGWECAMLSGLIKRPD